MSKKIGVLFSGGLDSTYLIWKNLKEGNEVYPIYIEIDNNYNKSILEKNRINLLYQKFTEEFNVNHQIKIYPVDYALNVKVNSHGNGLMFKQIPIWIFGVLFQCGIDYDEIHIGYVMNDDAISYISDIKKIYSSYKSITDIQIPLKFPLVKINKYQMAGELPSKYFDLVVSCENPIIKESKGVEIVEYEPCCECEACMKIISTKYYNKEQFPDYYQEAITRNMIRDLRFKGFKVLDKDGNDYMNNSMLEKVNISRQLEIPFECVGINYERYDKI